jgi:hypothetical protein
MSGRHGDKARFDRERKKKNLHRKRTRELCKELLLEKKQQQRQVPSPNKEKTALNGSRRVSKADNRLECTL